MTIPPTFFIMFKLAAKSLLILLTVAPNTINTNENPIMKKIERSNKFLFALLELTSDTAVPAI